VHGFRLRRAGNAEAAHDLTAETFVTGLPVSLYYDLWYDREVARTVQARLDEHSEQDLAVLRNEGHSDSEAIRLALHEAAELRRRKSVLRLEAEAAAVDPDDLAEALRVRAEMDAIAAVWEDAG
jgi:hypothetical protein